MTQHATTATAALSYLHALFDYLRLRGVTDEAVLQGRALDFSQREARITEREAAVLFNHAAQLLGDDALGLHVGETIRPGHYGVLGYVAMACTTLGEALECQRRYQALVLSIPPVTLDLQGSTLSLIWHSDDDATYRQLAEFNLSGILTYVRWITGQSLSPLRIDMTYPAPADTTEHRRIYGCEVRFSQPRYRLMMPKAALQLPLVQPDPAMRQMMDRLAAHKMETLRRSDDPLNAARQLIVKQIEDGGVELAGIAAQLKLSTRSLQRLLQEQGLSFTQLVDGVRRELAERYLADASLDLTDIAFLLGFSEQSAFQRAFKRWTGKTPAAFRAAH
jgi:AraC-like DNA-binding protein